MQTCYRHSSRETGVSCSNCGRPICPDCMTPTSVGMRCPECSRERTKVKTARTLSSDPVLTQILIAINVVVWFAELATGNGGHFGGSTLIDQGGLFGPAINQGHDYWRLVTSGFLHSDVLPGGILHIGFNMYLLWILGQMLEPAIGRVRFGLIYAIGLLAGSFGALALTHNSVTVGASGAVFGLMGATVVTMRARGIDPMSSGIPGLILLNLVFSFTFSGISIGGHIGGLVGGAIAAFLLVEIGEHRVGSANLALGACVALAAAIAVGAIAISGTGLGG